MLSWAVGWISASRNEHTAGRLAGHALLLFWVGVKCTHAWKWLLVGLVLLWLEISLNDGIGEKRLLQTGRYVA